jgi:Fe2+ transport system protein FeoA
MCTLKALKPGVDARVIRVHGEGALRRRIMEMGLTPSALIRVRKSRRWATLLRSWCGTTRSRCARQTPR